MLFDNNIQARLSGVELEMAAETMKRYFRCEFPIDGKLEDASDSMIKLTESGLVLDLTYQTSTAYIDRVLLAGTLRLDGMKTPPQLHICKVIGTLNIYSDQLETLEGLFTEDCDIEGTLVLRENKRLVTLRGCPQRVKHFICISNPRLLSNQVWNGPRFCNIYEWEGENGRWFTEQTSTYKNFENFTKGYNYITQEEKHTHLFKQWLNNFNPHLSDYGEWLIRKINKIVIPYSNEVNHTRIYAFGRTGKFLEGERDVV